MILPRAYACRFSVFARKYRVKNTGRASTEKNRFTQATKKPPEGGWWGWGVDALAVVGAGGLFLVGECQACAPSTDEAEQDFQHV